MTFALFQSAETSPITIMPFPRSLTVALQWLPQHPWVQPIRPHGLVHVHISHQIQLQVSFSFPSTISGCPHSASPRAPAPAPISYMFPFSVRSNLGIQHCPNIYIPTSPSWVASMRWSRVSPFAHLCQDNTIGALQRPPWWPGPCWRDALGWLMSPMMSRTCKRGASSGGLKASSDASPWKKLLASSPNADEVKHPKSVLPSSFYLKMLPSIAGRTTPGRKASS